MGKKSAKKLKKKGGNMGKGKSTPKPKRAATDEPAAPDSAVFEPATPQRAAEMPEAVRSEATHRAKVSRETLPRPTSTRILVIANQKGGVGKTTSVVNIATVLANGGNRVLVMDLDPQGNASTALGIEHHSGTPGTYDVLLENTAIADVVQHSPESANLAVVPSSVDLAAAEIQLVSTVARESRLQRAIQTYQKDHDLDYVFLDCPPSLGLLTLNALVAATEIMIPIQCEYYALEGVSQLLNTITLVKGELNDDLKLSTVLLTMYDARTLLSSQVADEVRNAFPSETLQSVIPRSVRIAEAPSYGQTVVTYDPRSAGAEAYTNAAREIAERAVNKES